LVGALIAPAGPCIAASGAGGQALFQHWLPVPLALTRLAPVVGGVCIRACGGGGEMYCGWVSPQPVRPSPAMVKPPTWTHVRSVRVRIAVLPLSWDDPPSLFGRLPDCPIA